MGLKLKDLFLRDFYLVNGLVPVEGFDAENISDFIDKLNSLPPAERRKAKRKFRKVFRKLRKQAVKNDFAHAPQLGSVGVEPTDKIKKARRRFVHRLCCHLTRENR